MAFEVQQNHTLLYKLGLFIISLLIVICVSISLVAYNDVSNSTANNGISAATADSAYVFFAWGLLVPVVLYMLYRLLILVIDPKFRSGVKIVIENVKETVSSTASYIKQNIPSTSDSGYKANNLKTGSGSGFGVVKTPGGAVNIVRL